MPIAEEPEPRPAGGDEPNGSDPSGAGRKDPFADLVLDEEFVRSATVKEQSGRTRMLSARWKHTPPVDPGGRRSVNDGPPARGHRFRRKPVRKPVRPARAVDAWGDPRPRRRLEWRTPLYVLLTVAVLLVALNIDGLKLWYSTHFGYASDHPVSASPAAERDGRQPTPDHPWAGSPAEDWAAGTDGIELPKTPRATGAFGADEVAARLQSVRAYLAAAHLDPKVVSGGRPDAALAMLDGRTREAAAASLDHPSATSDPTAWFTRFDPREAVPVTDVVKVRGRIDVTADGENGVLMRADVSYVYALRPGPKTADQAASANGSADLAETVRTIVRQVDTFHFYDPAKYQVDPGKLAIDETVESFGNSTCGRYDGFLHPEFDRSTRPGPVPTGPTADPYDRDRVPPGTGNCGSASRT
ncbi:hypothetical protein [Kitasatospora sp. NPDC056800]|uniref:SCO2583/SCO2584 N-terminal domain-containing protein n=1 Tax=Kitasatospora sp. NPDC056800 TaxID=3345948 RepID=UPI0036A86074